MVFVRHRGRAGSITGTLQPNEVPESRYTGVRSVVVENGVLWGAFASLGRFPALDEFQMAAWAYLCRLSSVQKIYVERDRAIDARNIAIRMSYGYAAAYARCNVTFTFSVSKSKQALGDSRDESWAASSYPEVHGDWDDFEDWERLGFQHFPQARLDLYFKVLLDQLEMLKQMVFNGLSLHVADPIDSRHGDLRIFRLEPAGETARLARDETERVWHFSQGLSFPVPLSASLHNERFTSRQRQLERGEQQPVEATARLSI
jgi:hypothetical protein